MYLYAKLVNLSGSGGYKFGLKYSIRKFKKIINKKSLEV